MTLIDVMLVLTCGVALIRGPLSTPLTLTAVLLAAATVLLEGWRAPLVPAYTVCIALLIVAFLPLERMSQSLQLLGLAAGLVVLAATVVASIVLPATLYPPVTGPYGIGTAPVAPELIERFTPKSTRPENRPAPMARLWYPTPASPQSSIGRRLEPQGRKAAVDGAPLAATPARLPIVIYFSGWSGTVIQHFVLIRELVSRGFVVVSLTYPGKLPSMSTTDFASLQPEYAEPYSYASHALARRTEELFERRVRHGAQDASAMLDLLDAVNREGAISWLRDRLDTDHAGVLGFSMGGAIATQSGWLEPRFKAVVDLDGKHHNESLLEGVPRPYLFMSQVLHVPTPADLTSPDLETRYHAELDQVDYANLARNFERHGGMHVMVTGASHLNFTDANLRSPLRRLRWGGSIDRFQALELVKTYVCSFFERQLLGKSEPLLDGNSSRFPEAIVKIWPAPAIPPSAAMPPSGNLAASP